VRREFSRKVKVMAAKKAIMILGTSPKSAKSVLAIGLCRLFAILGLRVAPFKAVSVIRENSVGDPAAIRGGGLYHQCQAARIQFRELMNPVVIRMEDESSGVLLLRGEEITEIRLLNEDTACTGALPRDLRSRIVCAVHEAYCSLQEEFDFLVIEGAGSPVDLTPDEDIPNILVARMTAAPIVFSCKFSRGGGAASLVGSVRCLPEDVRKLVVGFSFSDVLSEDGLGHSVKLVQSHLAIPYIGTVPRVPLWSAGIDSYELLAETLRRRLDWRTLGWPGDLHEEG
jgi:adenosylcobyric acid synthase